MNAPAATTGASKAATVAPMARFLELPEAVSTDVDAVKVSSDFEGALALAAVLRLCFAMISPARGGAAIVPTVR